MSGIVITKLVREHHPVEMMAGDKTLGQYIDERIAESLATGAELHEISVEISQEDAQRMLHDFRQSFPDGRPPTMESGNGKRMKPRL